MITISPFSVQGEAGVYTASKEFIKKLREESSKKGALLIIDEVQSGVGRTGNLYSYMDYDIEPDIVTSAKGLGGGIPIGATSVGFCNTIVQNKINNKICENKNEISNWGNELIWSFLERYKRF